MRMLTFHNSAMRWEGPRKMGWPRLGGWHIWAPGKLTAYGRPSKKNVFFWESFRNCVNSPTHPRVFVRLWKTKGEIRVKKGVRGDLGGFWGVWTTGRCLGTSHPPTHIWENFPSPKNFFLDGFPNDVGVTYIHTSSKYGLNWVGKQKCLFELVIGIESPVKSSALPDHLSVTAVISSKSIWRDHQLQTTHVPMMWWPPIWWAH